MASYSNTKRALLLNLYQWAISPTSPSQITGRELIALAGDDVSHPVANAVLSEFRDEGFLDIEQGSPNEADRRYSITSGFLEFVEEVNATDQNSKTPRTFTHFREILLIELARKDHDSGPGYYDLQDIADESGIKYKEGWVSKAAYFFRDHGFINEAFSLGGGSDGNLDASLTAEGLEEAERLGFSSSDESGDERFIPASDRVVSLDHNSTEYVEAIDKLELLTREFEADETLSNELGPERNGLVKVLKGARDLLDDYQIGLQLYVGVVIRPLERLKEIAAEHPAVTWGAFLVAALDALKSLAGI